MEGLPRLGRYNEVDDDCGQSDTERNGMQWCGTPCSVICEEEDRAVIMSARSALAGGGKGRHRRHDLGRALGNAEEREITFLLLLFVLLLSLGGRGAVAIRAAARNLCLVRRGERKAREGKRVRKGEKERERRRWRGNRVGDKRVFLIHRPLRPLRPLPPSSPHSSTWLLGWWGGGGTRDISATPH